MTNPTTPLTRVAVVPRTDSRHDLLTESILAALHALIASSQEHGR